MNMPARTKLAANFDCICFCALTTKYVFFLHRIQKQCKSVSHYKMKVQVSFLVFPLKYLSKHLLARYSLKILGSTHHLIHDPTGSMTLEEKDTIDREARQWKKSSNNPIVMDFWIVLWIRFYVKVIFYSVRTLNWTFKRSVIRNLCLKQVDGLCPQIPISQ